MGSTIVAARSPAACKVRRWAVSSRLDSVPVVHRKTLGDAFTLFVLRGAHPASRRQSQCKVSVGSTASATDQRVAHILSEVLEVEVVGDHRSAALDEIDLHNQSSTGRAV